MNTYIAVVGRVNPAGFRTTASAKRHVITGMDKEEVIRQAIATRDEWTASMAESETPGRYRVFVGELTSEIVAPPPVVFKEVPLNIPPFSGWRPRIDGYR